jgi:hypothetical protein
MRGIGNAGLVCGTLTYIQRIEQEKNLIFVDEWQHISFMVFSHRGLRAHSNDITSLWGEFN